MAGRVHLCFVLKAKSMEASPVQRKTELPCSLPSWGPPQEWRSVEGDVQVRVGKASADWSPDPYPWLPRWRICHNCPYYPHPPPVQLGNTKRSCVVASGMVKTMAPEPPHRVTEGAPKRPPSNEGFDWPCVYGGQPIFGCVEAMCSKMGAHFRLTFDLPKEPAKNRAETQKRGSTSSGTQPNMWVGFLQSATPEEPTTPTTLKGHCPSVGN